MTQRCQNFDLLTYGDCHIQNNAWGFQGPNPPQCIFAPPGHLVGWNWAWPGNDNSKVLAYPEIIFGKKPWNQDSTTTILPAQLNAIHSMSVSYSVHTPANGAYNAAFELWLTSSDHADEHSITTEIMVWVSRKGLNPAGSHVQTINTPYGQADLYEVQMHNWRYLAFVLSNELLAGTMDLKFFVDHLVQLGRVSTADYVASIEFGNEIAFGQGVTTVNHYSVNVA